METTPRINEILVWFWIKVCGEFDDVTSAGKLFHVRAAAMGNAWSPTVDSRVDVQYRRRRWLQLSTGNPGNRLKDVGFYKFIGGFKGSSKTKNITLIGKNRIKIKTSHQQNVVIADRMLLTQLTATTIQLYFALTNTHSYYYTQVHLVFEISWHSLFNT